MKKILPFLLSILFLSTLSAKTNTKFENGWWWYEEEVKTPDSNKTEKIRYKLSPAEKRKIDAQKNTNKLLKMLIQTQEENKKLNKQILARLIYAFPHTTPKYGISKKTGEKCLANSSADCFIMPVIAEGQRVPALKKFLRNPSPENSKNWLQWQATYFNHINKVSNGLRFAFLKGGSEAYPTATDYTYGDNLWFGKAEDVRGEREGKIIAKNKDKIAYLIFLGQNRLYESLNDTYKKISNMNTGFMKHIDKAIVLPSKESLAFFKAKLNNYRKQGYKSVIDFFRNIKISIRPDLYKKYKIRVSPTIVVYYKDKKRTLWQPLLTGEVSIARLREATINFLKYNGIISAKEIGADKNWNVIEKPVLKELSRLPKLKEATDFNKTERKLDKLEKEDKE